MDNARYRLRRAAGLYWLVDSRPGASYSAPAPLNEAGAGLWRVFEGGGSGGEAVEWLCREYGIGKSQAEEDVEKFIAQLRGRGIEIGGAK